MPRGRAQPTAAASGHRRTRAPIVAVGALLLAAAGLAAGLAAGIGAAPGDGTLYVWPSPVGRVDLAPAGTAATDPAVAVSTCENASADPSDFEGCTVLYPAGTPVKLTAVATGSPFHHWSSAECGTGAECTVTAPDASGRISVFAFFDPVRLKVIPTGTGRVLGPGGIDCTGDDGSPCSANLTPGQAVTLTAVSDRGWSWKFGCLPAGGDPSAATCVAQPETFFVGIRFADAEFDPSLPFGVQVDFRVLKSGSGGGQVAGDGIQCGSSCLKNFDFGQPVTLNATPDGGSRFESWQGACSTAATCRFTAGPITSIRAVFEALPTTTQTTTTTSTTTGTTTTATTTSRPPARLRGRITRVRVGAAPPYRVRVWIEVSKAARANLRIGRGKTTYVRRGATLRRGVGSLVATVPRRAGRGRAWLVVGLRDRDGQALTLRRVIVLGR